MEIVFTLLAKDIQDFESQLIRIAPVCKVFQIDIQDGVYVPNTTLPSEKICDAVPHLIVSHSASLAGCTFDFHLQIADYSSSLEALHALNDVVPIRHVFVHTNFPLSSQSSIENWSLKIENLSLCPALNPEDQCAKDALFVGRPLLSFPAIQIMTIHPGPQGQTFIPKQLDKIAYLRQQGYKGRVFIDGGVNPSTLQYILSLPPAYRPDTICVGSYLSRAPEQDFRERIEVLKTLVK